MPEGAGRRRGATGRTFPGRPPPPTGACRWRLQVWTIKPAAQVDRPRSSFKKEQSLRAQPDLQDQPGEDIELACLPASPVGAQEAHATPQLFGGAQMAPTAADAQQAASPPAYVHCHSFDVARCAVSVLKFAPGSADRLAWGADDGAVYLATAEQPPRLLQVPAGSASFPASAFCGV